MSTPTHRLRAHPGRTRTSRDPDGPDVADVVDEAITRRPWVERVLRAGWVAKGVVYLLMGMTAFAFARHTGTGDEASPEGALGQLAEQPGGVALLAVAGTGLLLYSAWRLISVALVRGSDGHAWLRRVGYLFSAAFYVMVGRAGIVAAMHGDRPRDSDSVERASQWALDAPAGRWLLLVAGAVVIVVGIWFVIDRGLHRSFLDSLCFEDVVPGERAAVVWAGTLGWIGRGIVTALVGFFVARSAWTARGQEARGFDRALHDVAATTVGSWLVGVAAIGLVLYGIFCAAAVRHVEIEG